MDWSWIQLHMQRRRRQLKNYVAIPLVTGLFIGLGLFLGEHVLSRYIAVILAGGRRLFIQSQ